MTLASTAQSLNPGNLITLLEIDFSTCIDFKPTGTTYLRLCASRNGTSNIVYNGNSYDYVGFQVTGLGSELNGQPPQPLLTFDKASLNYNSTYNALFQQYVTQKQDYYFDWRGAKIKIFRTLNLDLANQMATHEYVVNQISKETENTLEVKLAVSIGIDKANSDSIQTLSVNRCALRYRRWNSTTNTFDYVDEKAGGCPYGNPTTVSNWSAVPSFGIKYFNSVDQALTDANKNLDKCSYTVKGCQLRFDPSLQGLALPFTGLYSPNTLGT